MASLSGIPPPSFSETSRSKGNPAAAPATSSSPLSLSFRSSVVLSRKAAASLSSAGSAGDKTSSSSTRRGVVTAAKGGSAKGKGGKKGGGVKTIEEPPPQQQTTGVSIVETPEADSRVRLTVSVPEAVCKKAWEQTLRDVTKSVQIDGFRKGDRVPEYLLLRHVGEEEVKRAALEAVLFATLPEALDTVAGKALKDSEHIKQNREDLVGSFSPTAPFHYDVTVDVIPDVKWASDRAYASLSVEVAVEDEANGPAAVEAQLRSRHKDLGSLRVSTNSQGLKLGDVAVVDIKAFRVSADGALADPIYSATQNGFQFDTEESTLNLLPGFVDQLLGIQNSETREFDLTFPDTWQQESLRGVSGRFQVTCKEIFERDLPALEDSLAEKFLPGAKSMEEVKGKILQLWSQDREQKKKQATMLALLDALADVCSMEVPPSLLEEQGRQVYGAKLIELQAGGRLSKDDAASLMSEEMVNNYLVANKSKIERQVKQALAVQEVFRLENLTYSDEELAAEVKSAVAEFKAYGQEYDEGKVEEQAREILEGAKVLEWLTKNSNVSYVSK